MRENLESLELSENRVEMIEIYSKTPSVPQIAHICRVTKPIVKIQAEIVFALQTIS